MSMARALQRILGGVPLVAALLLLTGCYETDVALIASGDAVEIAGRYACKIQTGDGENFELSLTDHAGDAYRFTAPDIAGTVKLKKLAEARWLLQLSDDKDAGSFYYAFAEPMAGGGFRALYPKRENEELSGEAMRRYAIRFYNFMGREDATGSSLKGTPENLLKFLADSALHDLKPWFTCEKS